MNAAAKGQRDGRTVRAERTRQALVDALLELLYEGELQPTAERISARAGVSERSLFQHFADREALYQAVAVQQYERIMPTLDPVDVSLPLSERIETFVAQRAQLLETVTPVRRAALLLEPESEVVAGWLQNTRRQKAREVERVFRPELETIEQRERGVLLRRARVGVRVDGVGGAARAPAPERGPCPRGDAHRAGGAPSPAALTRSPESPARSSRSAPRPSRGPAPPRSSRRGRPRTRTPRGSRRRAARA